MTAKGKSTAPVRWREDTGWELRCPDCALAGQGPHFWPLTDEFWDRTRMARCRACDALRERMWMRDKRADPAKRARDRETTRRWRERHPGYNAAYMAARRARLRGETAA